MWKKVSRPAEILGGDVCPAFLRCMADTRWLRSMHVPPDSKIPWDITKERPGDHIKAEIATAT